MTDIYEKMKVYYKGRTKYVPHGFWKIDIMVGYRLWRCKDNTTQKSIDQRIKVIQF